MERTANNAKAFLHRSQFDGPLVVPPTRASTAPMGDKSRHHFHHHPHRHHHHRDKSIPQSAIQLHPSGGLLADSAPSKVLSRSHGPTPAKSAAGSRRESLTTSREESKKVVREADVNKAKEERQARNEELRKSIQSLTTLSTTATRRLDITYYNLLQTLSTLVSTISSLQELSSSTTHLQQDFQSEANVLQQDIEGQINAFHGFDTQQTKIERLQGLMQQRRTKVEELGKRLEDVKRRVEKWERREGDWQAMVSRRLKLLWGGIAAVVLVVVILLVLHHLPAKPYEHANHLLQNKTLGMGLMGSPDDTDFTKPSIFAAISKSHITSGSTTENSLRHVASSQSSTDPRLRMFDEL